VQSPWQLKLLDKFSKLTTFLIQDKIKEIFIKINW
jgi:hypothetical protein